MTYRKLLRQSFAIFCLAVRSATLCICSKRSLNSVSFWKKACIFATNSLSINAAGVGRISCSNSVSQLPDHNPVKLKLTYEYRFNGSMSSSERSLLSLGFSGGIGISWNRGLEINRHRTFQRLTNSTFIRLACIFVANYCNTIAGSRRYSVNGRSPFFRISSISISYCHFTPINVKESP